MPAVATAGGLPTRLGKYEILSPLAAGGMARIYIARTTGIGSFERHVVLKLITPERANDTIAVQMFLDEARLAASLNHQNVAQVFEVGEDAGIHYLAMEYVHGQDLRALLAKAGSQGTRVPLELALTVVAGAAAGLNHAHERRDGNGVPLGIVHRDVSPSNIMIGLDGSVKLLDFGIAKATARSVETVAGIIKGKFAYMSPEQCRGREVDRRSDVFSLGIILYEISTQHRCFRADSDFDTMHRIVTGDVVRPTRLVQGYPQALEAVVMKALAVDANQRYQSAHQLLEAIEAFAVSARMSLSTMALGRFMRDMFGETPEPWLAAGRNSNQAIAQPKESTVSSTNGSSEPGARSPTATPTAVAPAAVQQANLQAARTLLDLPPDPLEHYDRDEHVEWNAKSYPTSQPAYASVQTLPPGEVMRSSAMPAPVAAIASAAAPQAMPMGSGMISTPSRDNNASTPGLVVPPQQAFGANPGSGSHSAHPALPTTRNGFAGAPGQSQAPSQQSEISYPRYEPPPGDSAADLRLKPNRRPLIIGIVIVLIGVGIVLFVGLLSGPSVATNNSIKPVEPPPPTNTETTAPDKLPEVTPPPTGSQTETAPAVTPDAADESEESISIKVVSDPPQANVLLNGKVIGTTPLDTKIPRGNGGATLVVQRAGYEEVRTKIDLTGDFSKEVTLVRVEGKPEKTPDKVDKKPDKVEKKPDKKPAVTTPDKKPAVATPDKKPANTVSTPDKKPEKKPDPPKASCQPPNQIDPFDTRPVCGK